MAEDIKKTAEEVLNQVTDATSKMSRGLGDYSDSFKFNASLMAINKTLGIFGEATKGVRENVDGLGKAFNELYTVSTNENAVMSAFAKVAKGEVGPALSDLSKTFKTAVDGAQKFQVEMTKFGQDLTFQNSIREQAYALSTLGISYDSLKKANIGLVESYNASIRITDQQSKSFDSNRQAMSQLIVFNDKFGITQAETAKLLNFTKNTMGGGTEQAIKFSEQLEKFADVTGQKAGKVFGDFNGSLDRFSVMSADKAIGAFQRLQMTAARTGEPISKVFESIAKFDDIETGFQAGGQLNRVLSFMGGSFDTFKAIQADDDERAKMLFEAISGVSDKYSQLQTDQAKRSFASQLAASSGLDMKTIVGLLNKSTDLSKDIADISKRPLVAEGFTERERVEKMTALSTSDDFKAAKDGLLEAGKAAQVFADNLRQADRQRTAAFTSMSITFDEKVLTPIVKGQVSQIKNELKVFGQLAGEELKKILSEPSEAFKIGSQQLNEAVRILKGPQPVQNMSYPNQSNSVSKAFVR